MVIDDIMDARVLVEVGSRLAFGDAAHALGMPPATLSRRVARMEREAGVRLFERSTRKVALTDAGRVAIAHASRVLEAAGELEDFVDDTRSAPRGTVRISAMHAMAPTLLPGLSCEFLSTYPECQLAISLTDDTVDLVDAHVDIAIRAGEPGGADLVARRLGEVALRMHARPETAARIRTLDDLLEAPIGLFGQEAVTPPDGITIHPLRIHDGPEPRIVMVRPRMLGNDFGMLREIATCTDLVVGLPSMLTHDAVAEGTLVPVLPDLCGTTVDLFAVMLSRRHMRPAVRAFLDIAAAHIPRLLRGELREEARAA